MPTRVNIALGISDSNNQGKYFTFRLKQNLTNARSEFDQPAKTLVMADIEGNFTAFKRLLIKNRIINSKYKWIFEDGHLVIVGDCFARGEHVTECLWLIYSLEEQAQFAGGHIHYILGNHEIMNLNGDWRYIHPKYASSSKIPFTALYNGNNELWHWIRTKNIIERIGSTLYVHGGISNELLKLNLSVTEINNIAKPHYTNANTIFKDVALSAIFNSNSSPFWYRGYYKQEATEDLVDATLKHFNVNTIVTGHTVVENVSSFYNGKVINVDTDHANGNSEALLIKKNRFYRVDKDGNRERIK
jgi:hypothetical protein